LLPNGTVLEAGGSNNSAVTALASAEIYNPATQQWQSTPNMANGHWNATASLLPSGQVLVAGGVIFYSAGPSGGYIMSSVPSADLYNPATGTWSSAANMTTGRSSAAAVVLGNGTVLETGGYGPIGSNNGQVQSSAEIYNPTANTWTATGSMVVARAFHTATLLPNGTVLATGGQGPLGVVASAEIYNPSASSPSAPTVSGITPAGGPQTGGTVVTISGANLTGGSVSFGATAATSVSCAASSCTATSPAGTGTVNVTVTTTGGTSVTSTADQYTYQAAPPPVPTVTGITPASGPAAGGTGVTISGTNLTGGSVSFGTTAATGVTCATSSCTATSPAGTGTVNVTVTTTGGTSATGSADQFTYQAGGSSSNLIPDPGFETGGVPSDNWGSTLARSSAVVHSGSWSLAQTTTSSSGGWDLDSNPAWYAPITSATTYTASIWVYTTKTVKVDLNADLLNTAGNYVDSVNGPTVTLTAGSWTQLTITGIQPATGEVYAGMEPNFSSATTGTIIYWDDMSLAIP
jgi:hypothetical protein